MAVVDARVRVHHPCPYCDISVAFPASHLLLWCDNHRDVFLVSSPDANELARVLSLFRRRFHGRRLLEDGPQAIVEVADFEWEDPPSVARLARRAGVWALPPIVYAEGRETYRLVAPDRARMNRLLHRLRRIGDVELLSVVDRASLAPIRDVPTASVHFFEGLTDRQARSLLAAFDHGLWEIPARGSWREVARGLGLSRSTFGEHLRKGQLRLLANSYETLKARQAVTGGPVLLPSLAGPRAPARNLLPAARRVGRSRQ